MDTKKLRQKILDLAIHGKLVPQDPNDEPASVLLERIKAEKERLIKEGKIKKSKKSTKASDTPHYENVPFEVPESWVWCKFQDCMDVRDGTHDSPKYTQEGYPLITSKDFKNGQFDFSKTRYISEVDYKNIIKRSKVDIGDILYSMIGGNIGSMIYIQHDNYFDMAIKNVALFKPYQNSDISTKYIAYFLESKIKEYQAIAIGGAQPFVGLDIFRNTLVPLPPLAEQHRIITEIEKWLALIDQIEQGKVDLQTIIKQTKSKILDLAIHGKLVPQDPNDEPAIKLLKRINPDFTPCDNGQYRKIPKKWCVCKLVDICSFLSRGKSPKYSEDDKTYPVFAQKCNLKDGGISLEQARFLDPSTINKWNEVYKLQTGDILVNSTGTGTVGRTRLFNTNCLGNYPFVVPDSHVSVVRVLKSICPQYVYAYISSDSIQEYLEENLAGSTNQKELYIGVLENMHIYLPPFAEQQRIVARMEELFSTLDNIQKALEA